MARNKEFDRDDALDAAIGVFREHGFEGTSTDMLVRAMKIGRQSLYDTFGDKWKLYCLAVERYSIAETRAHIATLRGEPRAVDGIRAMIGRVVEDAQRACLGVGSICEFGESRQELSALRQTAGLQLKTAAEERIRKAQADGDIAGDATAGEIASFLIAGIAGIRVAARGGASRDDLRSLGRMTLRAIA